MRLYLDDEFTPRYTTRPWVGSTTEGQMDAVNRHEPTAHAIQTCRSIGPNRGSSASNSNSRKALKFNYYEGAHPVEHCFFFLIGFPKSHKWHRNNVQMRNKRTNPAAFMLKRQATNTTKPRYQLPTA